MEFNDRELAMLAWTGIALLWALSFRDLRAGLPDLFRAFLQLAIFVPLVAFAGYVAVWVWLAERVELWSFALINETVLWFLASGLVLFWGFDRVYEQDRFFTRTVRRALALGLFAEIFINLVVLPFWIELLLVPVISFIVLMEVFVQGKEEFAPVKKLADWLLALIGLALFSFVGISLLSNPGHLDPVFVLRLLTLPAWLTLVSLPFIYAVGLYAAYDKTFRRLGFLSSDRRTARRAKLALVKRLHLRARRVGAFDGSWQHELLDAAKANRAGSVMGEFLREQKQLATY